MNEIITKPYISIFKKYPEENYSIGHTSRLSTPVAVRHPQTTTLVLAKPLIPLITSSYNELLILLKEYFITSFVNLPDTIDFLESINSDLIVLTNTTSIPTHKTVELISKLNELEYPFYIKSTWEDLHFSAISFYDTSEKALDRQYVINTIPKDLNLDNNVYNDVYYDLIYSVNHNSFPSKILNEYLYKFSSTVKQQLLLNELKE